MISSDLICNYSSKCFPLDPKHSISAVLNAGESLKNRFKTEEAITVSLHFGNANWFKSFLDLFSKEELPQSLKFKVVDLFALYEAYWAILDSCLCSNIDSKGAEYLASACILWQEAFEAISSFTNSPALDAQKSIKLDLFKLRTSITQVSEINGYFAQTCQFKSKLSIESLN